MRMSGRLLLVVLLEITVYQCRGQVLAPPKAGQAHLKELFEEALELLGEGGKDAVREAVTILDNVSVSAESSQLRGAALSALAEIWLEESVAETRDPMKAGALFEEAAALNDPAGLHFMAFRRSIGAFLFDEEQNVEEATKMEEAAALAGHLPALLGMGFRLLHGIGVAKDCERALVLYKEAAAMNLQDQKPPFLTGRGDDVLAVLGEEDQIHDKSVRHRVDSLALRRELLDRLEQQSKAGNANALYEIGMILKNGLYGETKDMDLAIEYLSAAAERGHLKATGQLGLLYALGDEVFINQHSALGFLEFALQRGDATATAGLAYCQMNGIGISQNVAAARKLFLDAAAKGDAGSYYYLGEHLLVDGDLKTAREYFLRATQMRHIMGAHRLAEMFEYGFGGLRSCANAVTVYKAIAESGDRAEFVREALDELVEGGSAKAMMRYARAASEGIEIAQYNAGWLLIHGNGKLYHDPAGGAKKDRSKERAQAALRFFRFSALQGNVAAEAELGRIFFMSMDMQEAARHFAAAADGGHVESTRRLAAMYEDGKGVSQDLAKADQLYTRLFQRTPPGRGGPLTRMINKLTIGFHLVLVRMKSKLAGILRLGVRKDVPTKPLPAESKDKRGAAGSDESSRAEASGLLGEKLISSGLFWIYVHKEKAGVDVAKWERLCLGTSGSALTLAECDSVSSLWAWSSPATLAFDSEARSVGRKLVSVRGETSDQAGATGALCLDVVEITKSEDTSRNGAVRVIVRPAKSLSAAFAWAYDGERLMSADRERCVAILNGLDGGVTLVPRGGACAAIVMEEIEPFLFQGGEGFGDCLTFVDGGFWRSCDMHDPSMRWSVRLRDTANGGQYSIMRSILPPKTAPQCLIGKLLPSSRAQNAEWQIGLGECDSLSASRWSLAGGKLALDVGLCIGRASGGRATLVDCTSETVESVVVLI